MMWHKRLPDLPLFLLGMAAIGAVFYIFPFATNDGPIHLAFSHFLSGSSPFDGLSSALYRRSEPIYTNLTVYLVMSTLLHVFSPAVVEACIQAACLVGPPMAAYFALRQIDRDKTWLALFIYPLSLHHLFFLGLYNFCFSVSGFFLVIGSFLWMQKSGSVWRILAPVAALYFTFLSHAAGLIAAVVAISTLTLASCVLGLRQGRRPAQLIMEHGRQAAVFAALLPLLYLLLAHGGGGGAPVRYGVGLERRLMAMLYLNVINMHSIADKFAALMLSAMLWCGVVWAGVRLFKDRHFAPRASWERALGALFMVLVLFVLALVFPDTLGGGWTHFERMALFPLLAAPLCLACLPIRARGKLALITLITLASLVTLMTAVVAQSEVKRQLAPLAEVDRILGRHCSVLPLVFQARPVNKYVNYSPFFHAASRLELRDDRVVLFNFLARLSVYPVRYQEGRDPQEKLFGWRPQQQDVRVHMADIAGFERNAGVPVDYILQWGEVGAASVDLQAKLPEVMRGSRLVYRSADGRVRLFMREPDGHGRCTSRSAG